MESKNKLWGSNLPHHGYNLLPFLISFRHNHFYLCLYWHASIITFTGFVLIIEINQMGNYTSELAWAHKSSNLWFQILVLLTLGKESQMSLKDRANLNPFKRRSLLLFLFLDLEFGKTWRRVMKSPNRMRLWSAHFRAVLAASTSSTTTTILLTSITKPSSLLSSPSLNLCKHRICVSICESCLCLWFSLNEFKLRIKQSLSITLLLLTP